LNLTRLPRASKISYFSDRLLGYRAARRHSSSRSSNYKEIVAMRGKKARRNQAIRTPFQITKLGPKLPIVLASELVDNPSPCHGGTVAPSEACNSTRRDSRVRSIPRRRNPGQCARIGSALPQSSDIQNAGRHFAFVPKDDIAPPIISGSLDLRAEPDLLVAAARLVRPRHRRLEGGPRREVVVPCVDVRPALP
jgi:hypothetical protein